MSDLSPRPVDSVSDADMFRIVEVMDLFFKHVHILYPRTRVHFVVFADKGQTLIGVQFLVPNTKYLREGQKVDFCMRFDPDRSDAENADFLYRCFSAVQGMPVTYFPVPACII